MAHRIHQSQRVIIIGGGVSGLSIAARLAQAGLPVLVLEASRFGFGASTRNQGWLHSGAWFAARQPDLARMCYQSFQQTERFCPECFEPDSGPMTYLMSDPSTDSKKWTSAWDNAGLPYRELASQTLFERFPRLAISQAIEGYELPDRAMRPEVLLKALAEVAERSGADLCSGTVVSRLLMEDQAVVGVETASGEKIPARLVILAGNARCGELYPDFGTLAVGSQRDVVLVALKAHLVATRQRISPWPLCVVDADGFNHIPHPSASVFGNDRWLPIHNAEDEGPLEKEIDRLWNSIRRFFPDVSRGDYKTLEWDGTTVQAMHLDQIEPGHVPWPTVVDHEREHPCVENLLSVFPGRASLWAYLAEQAQNVVLEKLETMETKIESPPWGTLDVHAPVGPHPPAPV
jgi:glycerol-3-phosphate dehydrogenase